MKNRIYNGFNPNQNRGRGKASYLEKSFEAWLVDKLPQLEFHTEYSFKRFDQVKTYFADFYFPTKRLIIELDGSQHLGKKQKQYDQERDQYITDHYGGISNAD
jgi:very-short-patch-repair endonuclease